MSPKANFIACAEMAMKGHARSNALAAQATTEERRDYWLAQAKDDEERAPDDQQLTTAVQLATGNKDHFNPPHKYVSHTFRDVAAATGDVSGKCCLDPAEDPFYSPIIQERAWSSPIWYQPSASDSIRSR